MIEAPETQPIWTGEEIAILEQLVYEGLSWQAICESFDRREHPEKTADACRCKFQELCTERAKDIIINKIIRLHGQLGNDWKLIDVEFPRRDRPYLKELYTRYLRDAIRQANKVINEQLEGGNISKTLVRGVLGRHSEAFKRRVRETQSNYRLVEICLSRVVLASENPPKLRFEVRQLQKQLALIQRISSNLSPSLEPARLSGEQFAKRRRQLLGNPVGDSPLLRYKASIEMKVAGLIGMIESFNYDNPGFADELQKVRRLCSEMLPLYDLNQVELEEHFYRYSKRSKDIEQDQQDQAESEDEDKMLD